METLRFRHGRKRTNGFDSPYHRDQIISSLLYCTCTVGQFLICSVFLPSNGFIKYGVIILSATLSIITSINGILTTISNPEAFPDDKPMPLWCGRKSPRITRLCLDCQKTVLEFDHHCSFMNNCIGSKNYVPFIVMISCGSMQMVLQCITTILVQTYFYNISIVQNSFNLWVFYLLLALEIAVSFSCLLVTASYKLFVFVFETLSRDTDFCISRTGNALFELLSFLFVLHC